MTYYHSKYGIKNRRIKSKKSKLRRILSIFFILAFIISLFVGYLLYRMAFKSNTWVGENDKLYVYIPTGASYSDLKVILYEQGIVINRNDFEWMARKKNLANHIYPGRYAIKGGMSNIELINLLRSGQQEPINITFNNIRTKEDLAEKISSQIEADSIDIMRFLNDTAFASKNGFTPDGIMSMFIPDTYEVYWTCSAYEFVSRMLAEYKKFWNDDRLAKAKSLELSPLEVSILASIVEKETTKNDEKPDIAGVYLNRLKIGWRLQADPTIVFAWGDFGIRRVLNIHKEIDSPYNTYKNAGLPPGPICVPSIVSIDAVLNATDHGYLFFCAKDDFSGYHVFAKSNAQHIINANKYRRALNARNILH